MKSKIIIVFCIWTTLTFSQEFNKEITLENASKFMVGKINRKGLQAEPRALGSTKVTGIMKWITP